MMIDYNSVQNLKNILEENGFSMQKKFGQNFLINEKMRRSLVDELNLQSDNSVWEIGPGLGSMTKLLLETGAKVTVFEIDKGFIKLLKEIFSSYLESEQLRIVEGDVLKTWHNVFLEQGVPSALFGNLPYNIAATIIADTIEKDVRFNKIVVTVQKEVAERMYAKEGEKDYSSFSILCKWAYNVKPLFDLSPANFWPRPHVDSKSVLMTKKEEFPLCQNKTLFMKMQRSLFSSRRKNIKNNLSQFLKDDEKTRIVLEKANLDVNVRAETLPVKKLLELSDILNTAII